MKRLEEICIFIRNGLNIKNDKSKKGIPLTRIETISNGIIDINKTGYANIFDDKYIDYYLRQDDILMSHINSLKHLGKVGYCYYDMKIIHGMNLLNIRVNPNNVYPKYLYYYFKSNNFKIKLNKISKQSVNQSSFSISDLKKIRIDIIDLERQKLIVSKLDKVVEVISIRKKQIEELNILIKSQFVEMFGDIKNSKFDIKSIKSLVDTNIIKTKKKYKKSDIIKYVDISSINNLKNEIISYKEYEVGLEPSRAQQCLEKADILISTVRPNLKNIAVNNYEEDNIVVSSGFCVLRVNKCMKEYLFEVVKTEKFTNDMILLATGANYPAIRDKDILDYKIAVPPITLQNQFSEIVKQIDKQKFEIEKSLKETQGLYESLMEKYFG